MQKQALKIEGIPAIVWGEPSVRVYICVHGKLSCKEEARGFAAIAAQKGFQALSFDLPAHGERKNENYPCAVWNAVHDLGIIGDYAKQNWRSLRLYGSSLGAYFSLLAYKDLPLQKCLFLSPILDMERLIQKMMQAAGVSEQALRERREIPLPTGEPLSWEYYRYAKEHPVARWEAPTSILYGAEDTLTERDVIERFAKRFHCDLTVLEGGEHWFHTAEQLAVLNQWFAAQI